MSTNTESSSRSKPISAWVFVAGAAIIYLVTLNHWLTLRSMPAVARATGWDWHPNFSGPLFYLLTLPVLIFPKIWQPILLNLFSAACAALTLGLLARSVILIPQDRTKDQRLRTSEQLGLSGVRFAWCAPLAAVGALGLQFAFWDSATALASEAIDLLVFAYLIRALLELRASKNDTWLYKFMFVYGLGVANDWALIGYAPLFLVSVFWIRGLGLFSFKVISRCLLLGLAGLMLYLLLPAVNAFSAKSNLSFWTALKQNLQLQKFFVVNLAFVANPALRAHILMISLSSIFPLLLIGIRWPSFEGEINAAGAMITTALFRFIHIAFLAVCFSIFFDLKFSPKALGGELINLPFLSFYYLTALVVGYTTAYILLVFGKLPSRSWEHPSAAFQSFSKVVVALVALAAIAVPIGLAVKNFPAIRSRNTPALHELATQIAEHVPADHSVVISDNPATLMIVRAALAQLNRNVILIDSQGLGYGDYHRQLARNYPADRPYLLDTNNLPEKVQQIDQVRLLLSLSRERKLYYLEPSFGFFFETFYLDPQGPVYELKKYPSGTITYSKASPEQISANQDYWTRIKPHLLEIASRSKEHSDPRMAALFYSRALNYWGTMLEKSDRWKEAGEAFDLALTLNTTNSVAYINKDFNRARISHSAGTPIEELQKQMENSTSWQTTLSEQGPFDHPDFAFPVGEALARGENLRQSIQIFERILDLQPENSRARIALAKSQMDLPDLDRAFSLLEEYKKLHPNVSYVTGEAIDFARTYAQVLLKKKGIPEAEKFLLAAHQAQPDLDAINILLIEFYSQIRNYAKALEPVERILKTKPQDEKAVASKGVILAKLNKPDEALEWIEKAIVLNPNDETMVLFKAEVLYSKTNYQGVLNVVDGLLKKSPENIKALTIKSAALLSMKNYKGAIETATLAVKTAGNDIDAASALFDRAIAHLDNKDWDEARVDYERLLPLYAESGRVPFYYGLGEIAFQKKNFPEAIKNYESYLKYARAGESQEKTFVTERLAQLKNAK